MLCEPLQRPLLRMSPTAGDETSKGRHPENGRRRSFGTRRRHRQSEFQHTDRPRPSSPELFNKNQIKLFAILMLCICVGSRHKRPTVCVQLWTCNVSIYSLLHFYILQNRKCKVQTNMHTHIIVLSFTPGVFNPRPAGRLRPGNDVSPNTMRYEY